MTKRSRLVLVIFSLVFTIFILSIYKLYAGEKPKVVFVLRTLNNEYGQIIQAGVEKGCKDFGIEGKVIAPANGLGAEQLKLLDQVLQDDPDALVISPALVPEIIPKLEDFVTKNIPVILIDNDLSWDHKTAYIGTDNIELGKTAGIFMAAALQPGDKVALIGRQAAVSKERMNAAKASLEAAGITIAAENTDIELDDQDYAQKIKKLMELILQEHPDLKGVVTSTDTLAIPALRVIQEHGLSIPVTGADGISEMLKLVENGTLPGTLAQNPFDMGYLSAEKVVKVIKGEKFEKNKNSGIDIVTGDNVKERLDFLEKVLKK